MPSRPKLRIFAGPNGSGKTTLYNSIKSIYFSTNLFVNADILEEGFKINHFLNFSDFDIDVSDTTFQNFSRENRLFKKAEFQANTWNLVVKENVLVKYFSTMNLLLDILKAVDEAYLWDNSGQQHKYLGSFKNGEIQFEKGLVPQWVFTYIIDKIQKLVIS